MLIGLCVLLGGALMQAVHPIRVCSGDRVIVAILCVATLSLTGCARPGSDHRPCEVACFDSPVAHLDLREVAASQHHVSPETRFVSGGNTLAWTSSDHPTTASIVVFDGATGDSWTLKLADKNLLRGFALVDDVLYYGQAKGQAAVDCTFSVISQSVTPTELGREVYFENACGFLHGADRQWLLIENTGASALTLAAFSLADGSSVTLEKPWPTATLSRLNPIAVTEGRAIVLWLDPQAQESHLYEYNLPESRPRLLLPDVVEAHVAQDWIAAVQAHEGRDRLMAYSTSTRGPWEERYITKSEASFLTNPKAGFQMMGFRERLFSPSPETLNDAVVVLHAADGAPALIVDVTAIGDFNFLPGKLAMAAHIPESQESSHRLLVLNLDTRA